ncbi:hypothetical protein [Candidatus Magnetominusculus xianensis]|uniref:RING-type domain-containing protein n=1 Tax=Candidatus Magnetominusculus xianensis TaxID=1748249 RepID=A0ABR5SAS4_9BACT|nr:hypothetical protein [Candidatus Magnetominusculus xianensis]KWT74916.1 hypothetical protein ASN18_3309 [Candidatus Magnetominusculus xianensis]MBF0405536.1 hypothetical protein [Nitrospirota bacterium]
MTRALGDIVKDILVHKGAVIEDYGQCIDVLANPQIAETLAIPELTHLCLHPGTDTEDTKHLTYDSELFERFSGLFEGKGKLSQVTITPQQVSNEKVIAMLPGKITLNNAVFKHKDTGIKIISYLLLFFKYTALSDEKKEGIVQLLINESNLSTSVIEGGANAVIDVLGELTERNSKDQLEGTKHIVLQAAHKSLESIIRTELTDMIRSLNRRLNRNIERVTDYYDAMITEARLREQRKGSDDTATKTEDKINAIKTELKWKTQDLISKFALTVKTELLSAVRITSATPVFLISINRRKGVREFPISYNPILKRLDTLPCEYCFSPDKSYYICDDALHIVCKKCYSECSKCGKSFCSVCYPLGCPKCVRKLNSAEGAEALT